MKLKLFFSLGFFWGLIFFGGLLGNRMPRINGAFFRRFGTRFNSRRFRSWEGYRLTFVFEAIGLMAFGLAWLVKGQFAP